MAARSAFTLFLALSLVLAGSLCVAPARADDALARIRSRGVLRIATDATYPPFEYKDNGKLVGFEVDLAEEIGKELGIRVEIISMDWDGVKASVPTGKCDIALSGMTITEERKKSGFAFSRTYFLSGQAIARRKGDTTITKPEDLIQSTRTVAVQEETTGQTAMETRGMPKDRIHRFPKLTDALLDTRNGKSDAAVADLPALKDTIRKGYPELEVVPGGPFVAENLGIAGRQDSRDLIAAINIALERIMADGRYARMYEKWIGEPLTTGMIAQLYAEKDAGTTIPPEIIAQAEKELTHKPISNGESEKTFAGGSAFTLRLDILKTAFPALIVASGMTIALTVLTLIIGVPLGLLVAIARLVPVPPLRALATVYVEVVRGTPLLLQIYIIYYVLPALGVSLSPFIAGLTALSLNSAAYVSEIFRAGIESIDSGQGEAARALGMNGSQTMRFVILPQTIRRVLPPLTNEAVALLKDSSLVSVASLSELMRVGSEIVTTTAAPTTVYFAVGVIYLALTLPLTALVRHLEARLTPLSGARSAKK